MEIKIVPVTELKPKLLRVITQAHEIGQEYIVTKNGKPAAVIMNFDEWESWKETMDILSDQKAMQRIQKSTAFFKKGGKGLRLEQVFKS
ncbi:MAG: antitoxin YefM [Candidatus Omnitrophota bacterium]|jgi:antitoxin YefM